MGNHRRLNYGAKQASSINQSKLVKKQNSSTENMVLKFNEIFSKLSKVMTLEPGDIVSTGTPCGTGLPMSLDLCYLKDNDIIEVGVEKLECIRNKVVYVDK